MESSRQRYINTLLKEQNVMKKFLFRTVLCTLIALSLMYTHPTKAQGVGEVVTVITQVYQAANYLARNWDKIQWVFGGMDHTWWACVYQDGFTTYNNPRSYRNPNVVLNYFLGYDGDCDAFYYQNGAQVHLCYNSPSYAQRYAQQHGPIVNLLYLDGNGNWNSVLGYEVVEDSICLEFLSPHNEGFIIIIGCQLFKNLFKNFFYSFLHRFNPFNCVIE